MPCKCCVVWVKVTGRIKSYKLWSNKVNQFQKVVHWSNWIDFRSSNTAFILSANFTAIMGASVMNATATAPLYIGLEVKYVEPIRNLRFQMLDACVLRRYYNM